MRFGSPVVMSQAGSALIHWGAQTVMVIEVGRIVGGQLALDDSVRLRILHGGVALERSEGRVCGARRYPQRVIVAPDEVLDIGAVGRSNRRDLLG